MAKKKKKKAFEKPSEGKTELPQAAPEGSVQEQDIDGEESESAETAPSLARPEDRRDFLALTGRLAVGACALAALAGSVRLAWPDFQAGPMRRFPLGPSGDFKMRTLTWLRESDLFVVHDDGGFGAFSARCTHLGCTVTRVADGFLCPCHGARFGVDGRVLAGPARRGLPWFRVWIEPGGRLWVDTDEEIQGGTRPRAEIEVERTIGP